MGLDMYLKKGKKIPKKNINEIIEIEEQIYNGKNKVLLEKYKDYIFEKKYDWSSEINYELNEEVGYWRKANHIHAWFFENCKEQNDNYCLVDKEQIEMLLDICKFLIKHTKLKNDKIINGQSLKDGKWENNYIDGKTIIDNKYCKALLPTHSGFFFGSTDYDEWYIEDIKETIKILEKVLKITNFDKEYILYYGSW